MKLNIAFLWHLHQPYYLDPEENSFLLPWVRLHATKNYLFIADLFKEFPRLRHNINLVPSLIKQIEHYDKDGLIDTCFALSQKNAYDLTYEEKEYILKNFFHAHAETMIYRFPRYKELHERWRRTSGNVDRALKLFGITEITDLQVLFNLVWLNPVHYEGNNKIQEIVKKGRLFGEEDKRVLLEFHMEIIGNIINRFREVADAGIVELTVSPFYHPILPILIDSNCAELADPHVDLPPFRIAYPDDAMDQIKKAKEYFLNIFGFSPSGMWPSEGSVSEPALELMVNEGFRYTFTDELILSKGINEIIHRDTGGLPDKPEVLYQPYRYKDMDFHIFFRDHYLSDLIGFVYKNWDQETAANHLLSKFMDIRHNIKSKGLNPEDYIVSLIFDGENPWEYYPNYGIDFLRSLFDKLSNSEYLNVVTYNEYMNKKGKRNFPVLESIKPGSWIDGTFRIWFGQQEDFAAWKFIYKLKNLMSDSHINADKRSKALEYIRIAEGSDWYWWYGDEHFTANLLDFDKLFRKNIKMAYNCLDVDPPKSLEKEIFSQERLVQAIDGDMLVLRPKSFLNPVIDGRVTSYYEWIGAAKFVQSPTFGSMHRAGFGIINSLHAGYEKNTFFIRIDFQKETLKESGVIELKFDINDNHFEFEIDPLLKRVEFVDSVGNNVRQFVCAFDDVFEASFPLKMFLEEGRGTIHFFVVGISDRVFEERWPEMSEFKMRITGEDPAKEEWII